jgi:hypothetical protein
MMAFQNWYMYKNKQWSRICPTCKKSILHTEKWVRNKFERLKKKCKSCSITGIIRSDKHCINLSISNSGKKVSLKTRLKMSISQTGRKHSISTKEKMSGKNNGMYGIHRYQDLNPFYSKRHTETARLKMRLAAIKRFNNNGIIRSYNKLACNFMDKWGKLNGYKFQHAENGGEVDLFMVNESQSIKQFWKTWRFLRFVNEES